MKRVAILGRHKSLSGPRIRPRITQIERILHECGHCVLAESLPVAVYVTDEAGTIIFYNIAAVTLWGRCPSLHKEKFCGSWRLFSPDGRPMARSDCPMAVSLRENRAIHGAEILAERPDGSRRRLLAYPTPLHDEHGTLLGGVNMLVDISELAAARRKAEESSCAKSRFLAVASHDLRQPFLAMQLFQGILASKVKNDDAILTDLIEKHEPTLSVIVDKLGQALEQGVELLESLLDIATMEAGLLKPAICAFPVADIVERTARDCIKLAESKGLTFRTVSCHYLIRSDAVLLKRILRNLVVNAIKYTDRGGILIGCRRRRNSLAIEVWDTGPGIAKEHLETIFEAFYQINDVARARTEGLGLGLSIVTDIAKLLGHVVTVRSTLGRGSVFAVRVPLAG